MKCQRCKEREANVQIVQQVAGKKPQNLFLCEICAKDLGIAVPSIGKIGKLDFSPFVGLGDMFQTKIGLGSDDSVAQNNKTCDQCHTTFEEFTKSGLLGCSHCYDVFSSQLDPLFRRTQMGKNQTGRTCGQPSALKNSLQLSDLNKTGDMDGATVGDSSSDINEDLLMMEHQHLELLITEKKQALSEAVAAENYVLAARLRDELEALNQKGM